VLLVRSIKSCFRAVAAILASAIFFLSWASLLEYKQLIIRHFYQKAIPENAQIWHISGIFVF